EGAGTAAGPGRGAHSPGRRAHGSATRGGIHAPSVAGRADMRDTRHMPDTSTSLDRLLAEAVELARAVALEVGGDEVGEHVEVLAEDELVATHYFACLSNGYRGWRWAVTVARAPGVDEVTVDEVVLLPGETAVLSKEWVPYDQRLRPGDVGPGDLLPHRPDDTRLVPAYVDVDVDDAPVVFELGLGRERVLSVIGREEAAERWYDGDNGPFAPVAKQAPGPCASCGFYYRLSGALGSLFGACTNAYAPDDGRVVSVDHGCGAHSEAVPDIPLLPEPLPVILDDLAIDMVERDVPDDYVYLAEVVAADVTGVEDSVDQFADVLPDVPDYDEHPDEFSANY
ncbi:MAG: hypothetical protein JWM93_783, partial [Frankiales bacterium]|nr:hypothetical protein [Frankiales bacterium]